MDVFLRTYIYIWIYMYVYIIYCKLYIYGKWDTHIYIFPMGVRVGYNFLPGLQLSSPSPGPRDDAGSRVAGPSSHGGWPKDVGKIIPMVCIHVAYLSVLGRICIYSHIDKSIYICICLKI